MLFHNVEWIADGVHKFLQQPRKRKVPFFLYVAWTLPHNPEAATSLDADPCNTPAGLWSMDSRINRSAVLAARNAVKRLANVGGQQSRLGHRHYPLALAWMDSGVGMVLEALGEAGEALRPTAYSNE